MDFCSSDIFLRRDAYDVSCSLVLMFLYRDNLSDWDPDCTFGFSLIKCFASIETVERTIQGILVPFVIIKVTTSIVPNFKFYITCFLSLIFIGPVSILHLMAHFKGIFSIFGMNFYSGNGIESIVIVFGLNLAVWMNLIFEYRNFKNQV